MYVKTLRQYKQVQNLYAGHNADSLLYPNLLMHESAGINAMSAQQKSMASTGHHRSSKYRPWGGDAGRLTVLTAETGSQVASHCRSE